MLKRAHDGKVESRQPDAETSPQTSTRSSVGRRRILLVEDHPLMREGVALWIRRQPDLDVCGEVDSLPAYNAVFPVSQAQPEDADKPPSDQAASARRRPKTRPKEVGSLKSWHTGGRVPPPDSGRGTRIRRWRLANVVASPESTMRLPSFRDKGSLPLHRWRAGRIAARRSRSTWLAERKGRATISSTMPRTFGDPCLTLRRAQAGPDHS